MPTMEDVPPDLRPKIARAAPAPLVGPGGRRFIGSGTPEYPGANREPPASAAPEQKAEEPKETKEPDGTPCTRCKTPLLADTNFCQNCGLDLKRKRAGATLGIKITDEDIQNYLFKGFLAKEVELFEGHTVTFKSIQSKEIDDADVLTEQHFKDRRPTEIEWSNYRSKVLIAFGWAKLDGHSIGEKPSLRLEHINAQGSHMVELVGKKFTLFNTAISEVLNGEKLGES
jgi:hypothetical protein